MIYKIYHTRISQQTPSNSSSFVNIPLPDANDVPTSAKNGAESPNTRRLAARFRKSAASLLVTLFKILSTNKRLAWDPKNPKCLPVVETLELFPWG